MLSGRLWQMAGHGLHSLNMNADFSLSVCQDFNMSSCQNRQTGNTLLFNMVSSDVPFNPSPFPSVPGFLIIAKWAGGAGYPAPVENFNLPTNGGTAPFSYTASYLNGDYIPYNVIVGGPWLWVQGKTKELYGTVSIHNIVSPGVMSAPIVSYLVNGSTGGLYNNPFNPGIGLVVFWVGLTPAQIPAGQSNWLNGSLGFVLDIHN